MDEQKMENQGEEKLLTRKSSKSLLNEFFIDLLTDPIAWFTVVFHSYFSSIFSYSLFAYLLVWPIVFAIIFLYANRTCNRYERKEAIFTMAFVLNILLIFTNWGLNYLTHGIFSILAIVMVVATAISKIRAYNKLADQEKSQNNLPIMYGVVLSTVLTFTLFSIIVGYAFMAAFGGSEFYPIYGYYISFVINIIVSYLTAKNYPKKWLYFIFFFISPIVMYLIFNFYMSTLPRLIH